MGRGARENDVIAKMLGAGANAEALTAFIKR
jgi:hypothetical protein